MQTNIIKPSPRNDQKTGSEPQLCFNVLEFCFLYPSACGGIPRYILRVQCVRQHMDVVDVCLVCAMLATFSFDVVGVPFVRVYQLTVARLVRELRKCHKVVVVRNVAKH